MNANSIDFSTGQSEARLLGILGSVATDEEVDSIPTKKYLNCQNGFYVESAAIFILIRQSSELPKEQIDSVTRYDKVPLA